MALPEPEVKETPISKREKVPVVERKEGEIGPEVKDFLTRVETAAEIALPQPITDDQGQVIAEDVQPQKVMIELPLTEAGMVRGLHYKVTTSFRWLAEWCRRLVKITHGKFVYRGAKA